MTSTSDDRRRRRRRAACAIRATVARPAADAPASVSTVATASWTADDARRRTLAATARAISVARPLVREPDDLERRRAGPDWIAVVKPCGMTNAASAVAVRHGRPGRGLGGHVRDVGDAAPSPRRR